MGTADETSKVGLHCKEIHKIFVEDSISMPFWVALPPQSPRVLDSILSSEGFLYILP